MEHHAWPSTASLVKLMSYSWMQPKKRNHLNWNMVNKSIPLVEKEEISNSFIDFWETCFVVLQLRKWNDRARQPSCDQHVS
jgi:hypothetical protein